MDLHEKILDMGNMLPEHREVMDNFIFITRGKLKHSLCFSMREAKYAWPEDVDENGNQNRREPDLSILCGARKRKNLVYTEPPRFVAEVLSKGTEKDDRGWKMDLYLKVGVSEYWLIDPMKLSVERYMLSDDGEKWILHSVISDESPTEEKEGIKLLTMPFLHIPWNDLFYGLLEDA